MPASRRRTIPLSARAALVDVVDSSYEEYDGAPPFSARVVRALYDSGRFRVKPRALLDALGRRYGPDSEPAEIVDHVVTALGLVWEDDLVVLVADRSALARALADAARAWSASAKLGDLDDAVLAATWHGILERCLAPGAPLPTAPTWREMLVSFAESLRLGLWRDDPTHFAATADRMLGHAALAHGVVVRAPVRAWRWERGISPAVGDRLAHPRFGELVVVRLGDGKIQARDAGATERWLALPK